VSPPVDDGDPPIAAVELEGSKRRDAQFARLADVVRRKQDRLDEDAECGDVRASRVEVHRAQAHDRPGPDQGDQPSETLAHAFVTRRARDERLDLRIGLECEEKRLSGQGVVSPRVDGSSCFASRRVLQTRIDRTAPSADVEAGSPDAASWPQAVHGPVEAGDALMASVELSRSRARSASTGIDGGERREAIERALRLDRVFEPPDPTRDDRRRHCPRRPATRGHLRARRDGAHDRHAIESVTTRALLRRRERRSSQRSAVLLSLQRLEHALRLERLEDAESASNSKELLSKLRVLVEQLGELPFTGLAVGVVATEELRVDVDRSLVEGAAARISIGVSLRGHGDDSAKLRGSFGRRPLPVVPSLQDNRGVDRMSFSSCKTTSSSTSSLQAELRAEIATDSRVLGGAPGSGARDAEPLPVLDRRRLLVVGVLERRGDRRVEPVQVVTQRVVPLRRQLADQVGEQRPHAAHDLHAGAAAVADLVEGEASEVVPRRIGHDD
jgi:hypothetical protein